MNTTLALEQIGDQWYLVHTTITDGVLSTTLTACEGQDVRAGC
jgi:hypothetical protein